MEMSAPTTRGADRVAAAPALEETQPRQLGRYEIIAPLGRGGTAQVYRARVRGPAGFEKHVVLKQILPEYAQDPSFVEMLVAEAKVTAALTHPNIAQVFELERHEETWFMAMELVEGIDLLRLLNATGSSGGATPDPGIVMGIIAEVAKALDYAHTATDASGRPLGIVHRDISPSNVLLSRHGDVKLADFGVAYAEVNHALSRDATRLAGKLAYMAPELIAREPVDARVDIFGLGVIAFEALTLKRLFASKDPHRTLARVRACRVDERLARHPGIPGWIVPILRRALAKDPADRYSSAAEMHEAVLDGLFEARVRVRRADLAGWVCEVAPPPAPSEEPAEEPTLFDPRPMLTEPTVGITSQSGVLAAKPQAAEAPREPAPRRSQGRPAPNPQLRRAVFRLRDDDGGVFGPVTWDNLDWLLRSAAISPQEEVSIDGEAWVTVEEVSGIRVVEPELFAAADGPPDWERRLEPLGMATLLWDLHAARATGKLTLIRRRAMKQVWLSAGEPIHVTSNLKEELLGPFLVARGAVSEAHVAAAAADRKSDGAFLGEALIRQGALDAHQLFRHLETQLHEKMVELFRWRDGWAAFHEGVQAPEGAPYLRTDVRRVVAAGVRTHITPRELRSHFHGRLDYLVTLSDRASLVHHELALDARESRMARRIVAGRTLRAIATTETESHADRVALARVAYLLEQKGVLGFGRRR